MGSLVGTRGEGVWTTFSSRFDSLVCSFADLLERKKEHGNDNCFAHSIAFFFLIEEIENEEIEMSCHHASSRCVQMNLQWHNNLSNSTRGDIFGLIAQDALVNHALSKDQN